MRIAYVVDVHDRFGSVPTAMAQIGAVDLLIVGGDITTGGGPDDAERAIEGWRRWHRVCWRSPGTWTPGRSTRGSSSSA